jgi:predicted DNA-binding protein YlxM (UPF0122 family)
METEQYKLEIDKYPLILTAKDIAQILKVSKPTVYEIMKRTDFPLLNINPKRVLKEHFFEWLIRNTK